MKENQSMNLIKSVVSSYTYELMLILGSKYISFISAWIEWLKSEHALHTDFLHIHLKLFSTNSYKYHTDHRNIDFCADRLHFKYRASLKKWIMISRDNWTKIGSHSASIDNTAKSFYPTVPELVIYSQSHLLAKKIKKLWTFRNNIVCVKFFSIYSTCLVLLCCYRENLIQFLMFQ